MRASSSDSNSNDQEINESATVESAFAVGQEILRVFNSPGERAAIVQFLPDDVIDRALEKRSSQNNLTTINSSAIASADVDLMELLELAPTSSLTIDAFAMRGLILNPPDHVSTALSILRISSERCRQRFALTTTSGEEMHITIDLGLAESLEPRYRSFGVVKKWFLRGITGEAADPELATSPHPRHPPESIVAAQLAALKAGKPRQVFKFASTRNKAAFNGDVARFEEMLYSQDGGYAPLLSHTSAEILRSTQMTTGRNFCVVGITHGGPIPQRALYGWSLTLESEQPQWQNIEEGGNGGECWMTEAVYPLGPIRHFM